MFFIRYFLKSKYVKQQFPNFWFAEVSELGEERCWLTVIFPTAGADKKAEAGAGAATEFQFVSTAAVFF